MSEVRGPGFATRGPCDPSAVSRGWRPLAIAAAVFIASCGNPDGRHPSPVEAVPAGWRTLADGSLGRVQTLSGGDRRAERCWSGDGQDCVWINQRKSPHGQILVAGRVVQAAMPTAPEPIHGYNCAIYPGGVIEQRILRPRAAMLTRWSSEDERWSAAEVSQLLRQADLRASRFVSCEAVRRLLGDDAVDKLLSTGARRIIAPPA